MEDVWVDVRTIDGWMGGWMTEQMNVDQMDWLEMDGWMDGWLSTLSADFIQKTDLWSKYERQQIELPENFVE